MYLFYLTGCKTTANIGFLCKGVSETHPLAPGPGGYILKLNDNLAKTSNELPLFSTQAVLPYTVNI